ncbi:MAG: twin transmembrane helix small protein [Burkholderiales bacterium]|nr:MAG: twin transmembrane helix small protein [Burkholderiales bacterium]
MKYLVILGFVAIIGSLAAALVFMMRGDRAPGDESDNAPRNNHMARALAFRIGFSVLLFVVVLISYFMGWIQPTGLPLAR